MLRSFLIQALAPKRGLHCGLALGAHRQFADAPLLVPRRGLHLGLVVLARRQFPDDPFLEMPPCGNSNTNPSLHQEKIKERRSHRNGKILNVAILGIPNSGKSTLINKLVQKEVCAASCKHNTTRKQARAIKTEGDTQIVFLDTPGVVSEKEVKRFNLEDTLSKDPEKSCREADLLIVLQDLSNRYVREAIDPKILRLLCKYQHRVPSILVLNKLDLLPRKRRIFDLIRKLTCNRLDDGQSSSEQKISSHDPKWNVESYLKRLKRRSKHDDKEKDEDLTFQKVLQESYQGRVRDERAEELIQGLLGWPGFRDVFCISALDGDGVADLNAYILKCAKPGAHRYDRSLLLDQDPRDAVINIVKSKILDNVDREIPYKVHPQIEYWKYDDDEKVLHIAVSIKTTTTREKNHLLGIGGETIRRIAEQVELSLEDFFDTQVKFNVEAIVPERESINAHMTPVKPKPEAYLV